MPYRTVKLRQSRPRPRTIRGRLRSLRRRIRLFFHPWHRWPRCWGCHTRHRPWRMRCMSDGVFICNDDRFCRHIVIRLS